MADVILEKMRAANIPAFALATTLEKEQAHSLRAIVDKREFKNKFGLVSYILACDPAKGGRARATRVSAVFGKELVLVGQRVRFAPLYGFIREVRLQDYTVDADQAVLPVMQDVGSGYYVIPDFDVDVEPGGLIGPIWAETQSILSAHVNRGGGVIVTTDHAPHTNKSRYTPSFYSVLDGFTKVSV